MISFLLKFLFCDGSLGSDLLLHLACFEHGWMHGSFRACQARFVSYINAGHNAILHDLCEEDVRLRKTYAKKVLHFSSTPVRTYISDFRILQQ